MIVLYGPTDAPFTEKVVRALKLKGLEFELREPRTREDYRRWSPDTGLLPVIDIDGERVEDSTAILLRLDQRFPEPPLLSPDPRTRAMQLHLEDWVDESFFWYWLRWQRTRSEGPPTPPVDTASELGAADRARARKGPNRLGWLRSRGSPDDPEAARLLKELAQRLHDLERLLANRPFFYSDSISMADLAVYAMLRSLSADSIPGGASLLRRHRRLLDLSHRVAEATGG